MRAADAWTMVHGLPGTTLMENAGLAVARALESRFGKERRVAILCGLGNNGGDGFVIARVLKSDWTRVYVIGDPEKIKGDARHHYDRLRKERARLQVTVIQNEAEWSEKAAEIGRCSLVVDALLGSGSLGEPRDLIALAIEGIRRERARGARVVSVDLPSGVPTDGGPFEWKTVEADLTVTFAAKKHALVFSPGSEMAGSVVVASIGIKDEALQFDDRGTRLFELEESDARAAFPARAKDSHKGDFGHVLIVAGSLGKAGAAVLAARGAFRTGAGLVTVVSVGEVCRIVTMAQPEVMTTSLGEGAELGDLPRAAGRIIEIAAGMDAVVIGPGLGRSEKTQELVLDVVARCPRPVVIDADGLNNLAECNLAERAAWSIGTEQPVVLTPHPGEMARLIGSDAATVQSDRIGIARSFAAAHGCVLLLKGARTVIASPDGEIWINPTGNPGMASGGMGDVLSGMIGALLAQGLGVAEAARLGAFLHGAAADSVAAARGEIGMLASDVIEALPPVIAGLQSDWVDAAWETGE